MGSVELKLVYTSQLGTKTEVSKYFNADSTHIAGLITKIGGLITNDHNVAEWVESVLKFEAANAPTTRTQGYKRSADASGSGLKRWQKQPRVNGKFVKEKSNNSKGTSSSGGWVFWGLTVSMQPALCVASVALGVFC